MAEWETVTTHPDTYRLKVEGGWLYRFASAMEFVPASDPNARAAPRGSGDDAYPSMYRPRNPTKGIIDAEFEEVPAHKVNGSEVTTLTRKS